MVLIPHCCFSRNKSSKPAECSVRYNVLVTVPVHNHSPTAVLPPSQGEVHHVVPLRALDKFRINFPKIPRPRALLTGPACAGSQNSLSTFHKGSQYKPHRGQVKDSPNPHLQGQGACRYTDSDVSPSVVWSPRHGETCLFPVFLDSFLEKFEERLST